MFELTPEYERCDGFFVIPTPPRVPIVASLAIDGTCDSEVMAWNVQPSFPNAFTSPMPIGLYAFQTHAGHQFLLPLRWKESRHPDYGPPEKGDPDSFAAALTAWEAYVRIVSRVGVAVLEKRHANPEEISQYVMMILLFDRARRTKEHLSLNFGSAASLANRRNRYQHQSGQQPILPVGIGLHPGESGDGWTPKDLMKAGREAAAQSGLNNPTSEECIAFGLHAAATSNPTAVLPPDAAARRAVLYSALFDHAEPPSPDSGLDDELLLAAMNVLRDRDIRRYECRGKESDAAHLQWHAGPKANVPRLALQKLMDLQSCSKDDAVAAFQELHRRSVLFTGRAFSAAMQAWLQKAQEVVSLSNQEIELFNLMYTCKDELGGVPLALLFDRFNLLDPWLVATVDDPASPNWNVLYTMLTYYAAMAGQRREVDKQAKRSRKLQKPVPNRGHTVASPGRDARPAPSRAHDSASIDPDECHAPAPRPDFETQLNDLAKRYANTHFLSCDCLEPTWSGFADDEELRLVIKCSVCETIHTVLPNALKVPASDLIDNE